MEDLLEQEIENSLKALKDGKVILYPTDTIWGIGCDATNKNAVERVYKIKKREKGKSMIILLDSKEKIADYVEDVPEYVYDLIDNAKSPLTVIFQNAKNLAKNVVAEDNSIAIRIVKGKYCGELLRRFGKPVVSTSANFSGEPSPLTFSDISPKLIKKVDYAVKIMRDDIKSVKSSQIIKLESDGLFKVIRK